MRAKATTAILAALLVSSCGDAGTPEPRADHAYRAERAPTATDAPTPTATDSEPLPPTAATPAAATTALSQASPGSALSERPPAAQLPQAAPPAGDADQTERDAVVLAPSAGTYTYATRGHSESGSGPTRRRTDHPTTTTDHVAVINHERGTTVTVTTDLGDGSTQHLVLEITATEVHLTRLAWASTTAGVRSEQAVTPQPPILVVRAPYRVGDTWESSWEDRALGVQGIGTGGIVRSESLVTPAGHYETAVVKLDHRLRGSVTGRLQLTLWIDPTSATRVRDETIIDMTAAGSTSHTETARDLTAFAP